MSIDNKTKVAVGVVPTHLNLSDLSFLMKMANFPAPALAFLKSFLECVQFASLPR